MEDVKSIVSQNIVELRKNSKMTQQKLAERTAYSDKAISRWEKGECLPDIETLNSLSIIFGVPISYFFEKHDKVESNNQNFNKIMVTILSVLVVWALATVLYFYLHSFSNIVFWQVFVWALPISCIVLWYCNKLWGAKNLQVLLRSLFIWSVIISVYCQWINYNLWIIFLLGVPIQAIIIIAYYIQPIRPRNRK